MLGGWLGADSICPDASLSEYLNSESMSRTTAQSHQRPGSTRSWSAFFTPKQSSRSPDTPQILPTVPRVSRSDETSSVSSSRSSHSNFVGTSNPRLDGPPSYAHAVSRSSPTSYRFVQESPLSMSLVTQDGPPSIAYNISVGLNVWMPSEHITLVRRYANPDGPVIARLE